MLFSIGPLTEQAADLTVAALIIFLTAYELWLLANRFRQRRGDPPLRVHFSLRDLLWLTVVAALASGWWVDHRRSNTTDGQWSITVSTNKL